MKTFHLHLVSDATGETTHGITRACLAQFENIEVIEHLWSMVRSKNSLGIALTGIEKHPGAVIFTMINDQLREELQKKCKNLKIPCISVLDPVMHGLSNYFGVSIRGQPGRQHALDVEYYHRIEAMNYVMSHDDGQSAWDLKNADVVLVGVSRTSKTPTSMYLANQRGISTANVPIVPDCSLPEELFTLDGPLLVGLTNSAERLVQIRRHRLQMIKEDAETAYVDLERVKREVADARQIFTRHGWPVIDVTRRSIEETAAAILQLYTKHKGEGSS